MSELEKMIVTGVSNLDAPPPGVNGKEIIRCGDDLLRKKTDDSISEVTLYAQYGGEQIAITVCAEKGESMMDLLCVKMVQAAFDAGFRRGCPI